MTLRLRDRRSAASFRYRNRTEITVLMCERKPFQYGFCAGAKAFRYSVNTFRICDSPTLEIGAGQLRSVKEIAPKSPFLCVNRSPIQYGFCAGAKAFRYSVNTFRICDSPPTLLIRAARHCSVTVAEPKSQFLCVNRSPGPSCSKHV